MKRGRWYFRFEGHTYGPVGSMTQSEFLKYLRDQWGKCVPYWLEI